MQERTVVVKWRAGLHTRPASEIIKITNKFKSEIIFILEDEEINAKSILGVISLAAEYKSMITVKTHGIDEEEAIDAIVNFFETFE